MNKQDPGRAIRLLGTSIRIARAVLIALSLVILLLLAINVTGRGSMSVAATLEQPFTVEFDDGRRVSINGGIRSYENFEIGRERDHLTEVDDVGVTVNIDRSDTDSRIALSVMILIWLAAAWIVVHNLGGVVDSALHGKAFADENPARLRAVGYAVLTTGLSVVVGRLLLAQTIETDLPIQVAIGGTPIWISAAVGVAMFALAEVFGEAARLRQFEEATI